MSTLAPQWLDIAPVTPFGGGLAGTANVINATDPHLLINAEYLTDACSPRTGSMAGICPVPGVTKDLSGQPELVESEQFALYAGADCDLESLEDAERRANQRLAYAEGKSLDEYWLAWLQANAESVGAGDVLTSLGQLMCWASQNYGGQPTLWTTWAGWPLLQQARLNDLPVDVGILGCEDTTTAPLYITGRVTLIRGPIDSYSTYPTPASDCGDGNCEPRRAMAERQYVLMVECGAAGADITGCCGGA